MLSSTVRRSLLSLLAVSTVGTLGFSAAATLSVTADNLGSGDSAVEIACTDGVDVAWGAAYNATVTGFVVSDITLSGDDLDNCDGLDLQLAIVGDDTSTGISGTALLATIELDAAMVTGAGPAVTVTPGSGATLTLADDYTPGANVVKAEDVYHVAVVMAGTPTP